MKEGLNPLRWSGESIVMSSESVSCSNGNIFDNKDRDIDTRSVERDICVNFGTHYSRLLVLMREKTYLPTKPPHAIINTRVHMI